MTFDIHSSLEVLSRTPSTLEALLNGLSTPWLMNNEGEDTWSPYDIVGHLIHGEKTDWMPRARIILSSLEDKTFVPFDRFAQLNEDQERTMEALLKEFRAIRTENLKALRALPISETTLSETGIHPELGTVRLKELLSTWVVHDLGHISQITRVMAKQYNTEVGPWKEYLGILKS